MSCVTNADVLTRMISAAMNPHQASIIWVIFSWFPVLPIRHNLSHSVQLGLNQLWSLNCCQLYLCRV